MKSLRLGLLLVVSPLVLTACDEPSATPDPASMPDGGAAAPPEGSALGAAAPPLKPSGTTPMPTAASDDASPDTWLVARKDGVELAVIELRAGKPPKLEMESDGDDSAALKATIDKIGGPEGIGLDMHLPPESGQGRGAYGTRIVKYDDPLYRHALTNALEPTFSVKPVLRLTDPLPPPNVKQLHVSRSGEKIGKIDFTSTPPEVKVHTEKSGGDSLKRHWEQVQELGALKVRYHHPKDSVETLVTAEAKPGDASYNQTVILYLMVEQSYRARYAYALEFSE